ncbi:TROVE domain-containing protein [Actinoallomurus purpureus]|uniref:TROVE domain-containing protein n=1 Tax=Actinoallomurus purpureus TaxID=478114 RepID=UPI0020937721|nr:TROVE domain-containing protein [Actinoallomurus purpureus]MCO6011433.1 TROVE domain-containing protein [Actinoallomurus purpureus]
MSKFNQRGTRPAIFSPVRSETTPTGRTHEGAPGHARDAKSELFLLAIANMVGEDTFYERAKQRDDRYVTLVRQLAVADPDWTAALLAWLRTDANMRSAAIVGAAEYVHARLAAAGTRPRRPHEAGAEQAAVTFGGDNLAYHASANRRVVDSVLQRADEPGEMLAYWTSKYGRNIPKPVKRGVADAVARLYNERALLKYDTDSKGFRFGDVVDLVHPTAGSHAEAWGAWQGDLFKHALDRRHGRDNPIPETLITIGNHAELMSWPVEERRALFDRSQAAFVLKDAGMSWESVAGWLQGPLDAKVWEALIPSMGYMALLRNLRNFDQAGVSDEVAEQIAARIADPEQVAKSRQFPFRFLAAYNAAPSLRWAWALEKALNASLANVPALPGRTLILVDRSGSMFGPISERSGLNRADSAAIFGTALALRAASADLVEFGTSHRPIRLQAGSSVLTALKEFGSMGGTNTAEAVRANYRGHDRVVIVTDEQAWGGYHGANPTGQVPDNVPVYTWNLAGYQHGHGPSGHGQRHTFGGLTDRAFGLIPLLEAGRNATWPWKQKTP